MAKRFVLKGCLWFDGQKLRPKKTLFFDAGRLVGVDRPPEGFQPQLEIEASGKWLLPALCDLSVRLRSLDLKELRAARQGGILTLALQPTSNLPLDTPEKVALSCLREEFSVLPVAALTKRYAGERLAEIGQLLEAGAVALAATGNLQSFALWRRAFLYAATFNALIFIRPEEQTLGLGCAHEGITALRMGLPTIPWAAETMLLAALLELVAETGVRVHFSCLSCARSVELVAQAKARGLPVTADVSMAHLLWNEEVLSSWDTRFRLSPPLRSESDRRTLLEGVASGVIDAVVSDHTPLPLEAKAQPFPTATPGMASFETLLPSLLQLIERGELPEAALAALNERPCRILLGERPTGWLLLDPKVRWPVEERCWKSSGQNTPFWGEVLRGKVVALILPDRGYEEIESV